MDRQLRAMLVIARHRVDVREIEVRHYSLCIEVERQRDEVDVAGTLAVAEQAALDAVGAGHQAQLGRRHPGSTVFVRMQRDHHGLAP